MSLSVIDKYVEKKKKDILEYAKILESLIALEDNKMWNNKTEFSVISKEIISLYADKFYFDNNIHRDNPIEYSNDNINHVLQAIIEYSKKNNKESMLLDLKNETFLFSVIICTACYLDIATNVIDGVFVDTKSKFKYLLNYLKKTDFLKVYNSDRVRINELFKAIKKNTKEDAKFFEYFENENWFNRYLTYTKDPYYYMVTFEYNILGLQEFDSSLVTKVRRSYQTKLLDVSYELLSIHILKELISNREVGIYLLKMNDALNKKPSLLKVFSNAYCKKYVKVLVDLDMEINYRDALEEMKKMGIDVIYEYNEVGNVNENKFTYNMEIIVPDEFIKNNEENKYTWDKNGIKFVTKNMED